MIFEDTDIPGVKLIRPAPFSDDRGVFRRAFCAEEFAQAGIVNAVAQSNISENFKAGTLRGFHYQRAPHGEGKTLTCVAGAAHDIVVDLRSDSPTYLSWQAFSLTSRNRDAVHVPPGCANAFLTLEDNTVVVYFSSHPYTPEAESGIRFDDPLFSFDWPFLPSLVSDKDRSHPDFEVRS